MKKETAIEWLIGELNGYDEDCEIFRIAKAMEKEQSIFDYCAGFEASSEGWNAEHGLKNIHNVAEEINAEDYYNKTYAGGLDNYQNNAATLVIPINQIDLVNTTISSDTKWVLTLKNKKDD
jgi:hypothetical protein